MNLRLYIICIAAVLALVGPALANSTATVHGEVYGWDTFEPLENAVVDVNSTPSQSMVAKYGLYSFELVPGDYTITARYYQNSTLIYSAEETVKIKDEGKYVIDLLLLPVYSEELMGSSEVSGFSKKLNKSSGNSSNKVNPLTETAVDEANNSRNSSDGNYSNSVNVAEQTGAVPSTANYLLIALVLILLLAAGYRFTGKNKKIGKSVPKEEKREQITRTGHITGDFSEPIKMHELSVEVTNKNAEPELEPESQEKTVETEFATETVTEPVKEQVKEQANKIEPEIPERKVQAESKEEYPVQETELAPVQETELVGPGPEEENEIISLEEPEDNLKIETPAPKKKLPLPADLREVMDIIRGQGGRITQKDLRSKLRYSEGKVSLMLADLERRELIEKFKRGRGNVVILKDEER